MRRARSREELSKSEEAGLLAALGRHASSAYPNPERKGCPGEEVLRAIARREMSLAESKAHLEHITACSPCFSEYQQLRRGSHRRRVVARSALVVLSAVLGWAVHRYGDPVPSTDQVVLATLDLRKHSITRGQTSTPQVVGVLPRANLKLTISLPVGSGNGLYEIELWRGHKRVLGPVAGWCQTIGSVDRLDISANTRMLPRGQYELRIRQQELDWAAHQVELR